MLARLACYFPFMKKIFLVVLLFISLECAGHAQSKIKAVGPDAVVRNLYRVHVAGSGPFFQTKSRALVGRYFTKDLADLIWKDAVASKEGGGVGAIDFDPLYHAQDTRITAFKVGQPSYGDGNLKVADVEVSFKNMGKAERILFRVEQDAAHNWKISNIHYLSDNSSLRDILSNAAETPQASEIRKVDFRNFDYGDNCAGEHKFLGVMEDRLVLSKGHQQHGDELNYANFGSVKYVDFDGDGNEEAFVIVKGQTSGSSNDYLAAYVFAYRDGSAKQIWTRCEENSGAELKGNQILFTRPEWAERDAHCCFSQIATETYGWKDSGIVLLSTKRKKTGGK
ncbi:MAG: hypothetical protein ACJ74Q_26715 [Pyrinomonadaceae bacterium]